MLEHQHADGTCARPKMNAAGRPVTADPRQYDKAGRGSDSPSQQLGPTDPHAVPSLPGPPPRQSSVGTRTRDEGAPVVPHLVEGCSPLRVGGRSSGWMVSAVVHFGVIVGLSLIVGPLHLGPDEPLELNLTNEPPQPPVDPIELETVLDPEPVAPRFALLTSLPSDGPSPLSAQLAASPLDGRGKNGPRGTFFGTVAYGTRFIYVLDVSGSMKSKRGKGAGNTRLQCAIHELLYSVDNLTSDQFFYVVLFSDNTRQMFDEDTLVPQLIRATPENKRRLRKWLEDVRADSGTDPRAALRMALRMSPSAVFLLSDGEFNGQKRKINRDLLHGNPSVEEVVAAHDGHRIPVHTFALEDRKNRVEMKALADQTLGEYRYVPPISLPSVK